MRVVLALAVALALGASSAGAAALTVNEQHYEAQRVADEARAAAEAELADALVDAQQEQERLADLTLEGSTLLADARSFLALAPGWADPQLLAPLGEAVDALEREWEAEPPSGNPATSPELRALAGEAATMADRRADLLRSAKDAADDLARSAVADGASLAAMSLTTEEQRDAARTALGVVADDARAKTGVLASLTNYTAAWTTVHDAQAAAEAAAAAVAAAAAAAASTFGGSVDLGGGLGDGIVPPGWPYTPQTLNTVIAYGRYIQYCNGGPWTWGPSFVPVNGVVTLDFPDPYMWEVWHTFGDSVVVKFCA